MAIKKIITVDGIEVPFKASATLPRLYRAKFRKDIFKDFAALKDSVDESDEQDSGLGIESLEVFENIAWTMAKHADPENVYVLTELVGDELEIIDPYGGTLQAYGLCYETMRKTILKLVNLLNESEDNGTD